MLDWSLTNDDFGFSKFYKNKVTDFTLAFVNFSIQVVKINEKFTKFYKIHFDKNDFSKFYHTYGRIYYKKLSCWFLTTDYLGCGQFYKKNL